MGIDFWLLMGTGMGSRGSGFDTRLEVCGNDYCCSHSRAIIPISIPFLFPIHHGNENGTYVKVLFCTATCRNIWTTNRIYWVWEL